MPKFHGIELAANAVISNAVIESLASDPGTLVVGRIWYNSTSKNWKVGVDEGTLHSEVLAYVSQITTLINNLASTTVGQGSALIGYSGYPDLGLGPVGPLKNVIDIILDNVSTLNNDSTDYSNSITDLQTDISTLQTDIGIRANLVTEIKTNLVLAINEVSGVTQTNSDDITTLQGQFSTLNSGLSSVVTDLSTNYLNKTTSTAQVVVADTTFNGNIIVQGDIIQTGSNITTVGEDVLFEDNIVVLNSNVTGATDPIEDAGVAVNRGTKGNLTFIKWDETLDKVTAPRTIDTGTGVGTFDAIAFQTDVNAIDSRVTSLENAVDGATGDLATLTTDIKTTLVAAINEVVAHTDSNTSAISTLSGTVSTLSTNLSTLTTNVANRITAEGSTTAGQGTALIGYSGHSYVGTLGTYNVPAGNLENLLDGLIEEIYANNESILNTTISYLDTTAGQGSALIGFSGHTGTNGLYSIPAGTVENSLISVATELDSLNQDISTLTSGSTTAVENLKTAINATKYKTNSVSATSHTITHNLGSSEISANVWVKDGTVWRNHIVGITIIDNNSIQVDLTEAYEIKVLVEKFDTIA